MNRRGFTLIEVLTTITIIGVLVSVTSMVYSSSLKRSRDGQRKTDLDTIKNALEQYYLDNRNYPSYNISRGEGIYNARWQLEAGQVGGCQSNRGAIAPLFLPTVPEDPKNKLPTSAACNELTEINLSGEYLYFVGGNTTPPKSDPKPKAGFYLLAKMETAPKVNINTGVCSNTSSSRFLLWKLSDYTDSSCPTSGGGWNYSLNGLAFNNGIGNSVTHNYKVNSTPNN